MPDYNVAPTTFQPVICNSRDGAVRELLLMRWGLIPFFAKSPARPRPSPRNPPGVNPFKRGRRCLVPADGYYEWLVLGPKEKQPYAFTVGEDSTFAFAGLWDAWHDKKTDKWLQSFAILTTTPNELTRTAHSRMPVFCTNGTTMSGFYATKNRPSTCSSPSLLPRCVPDLSPAT